MPEQTVADAPPAEPVAETTPATIEPVPAAEPGAAPQLAEPAGSSAADAINAKASEANADMMAELGKQLDFAQQAYTMMTEFFVNYSMQVIGAIIIFLIGLMIARWASNLVLRVLEKRNIDVTLRLFLASSTKIIILVMVLVVCLGKFGISVAPFVAAIGAVGLGAGLAMQGLLSNYGAGFNIILTRPFVVGNTITIAGVSGVVKEIRLAMTLLETEDGELITIPNKFIVGEILHNSFEYKVVEAEIGISYEDDADACVQCIRDTLSGFEQVTQTPPPQVGIASFGDSSVNIGIRYWVPTQDYFSAQYTVNGAVYAAVKQAGFTIPFPQREVRMLNGAAGA